ncbi:MAG: hypothetical protein UT55_C0093G0009 [Candidatus Peregrinibacteria bacterium GW2011_GWE2_39_6]|nr:MAG: hypothetical protein UT36_C0005G0002 [Candidatus Peregrinibacteria bacterium GW2011_GWF2_39_17]KKR23418.1 MAG: hypothetical protein UT55_C0093G0009 [Candidatus Peregrinibacteria bacterium GW2011_GWE2_39_6]HCW32836.1 hypothetical protein [Candidatus Peregrinibacteria bacterium]
MPTEIVLPQRYRRYLLPMAIVSFLGWMAWVIVIFKLDPFESTGWILVLFFLSLFLALIGSFTLLGFGLRCWLGKEEVSYYHLTVALRQGILLSLCTLLCVGFLMLGILKWWNGFLLLIIAVLVESFITGRR